MKVCKVVIHLLAGWFGSWCITPKQSLFLNPYRKMNGKNTSGNYRLLKKCILWDEQTVRHAAKLMSLVEFLLVDAYYVRIEKVF